MEWRKDERANEEEERREKEELTVVVEGIVGSRDRNYRKHVLYGQTVGIWCY